ncbi:Mucin-5B [Halocaridina rubra]|uniref:Mucin-5B n=1 Tax=Halocaridina rubra TaxID=373956 RepID=A0AAN8WIN8_HALRR
MSMKFPASVVGQFPSCTKSVTIRLDGTLILFKQDREITVNGVVVKDLPSWPKGAYIKKVSSLFVMVELDNGLSVWWDGQTRVYIDAPAEFRGRTGGLCGTFTDSQRDDFLTPEGDIEPNAVAFANKWKTSEKCPDQPLNEESRPCDRHIQNKAVAEKYCAKLKSSLFASCHLEVDVEPYHRDCLYDMCSCEAKLDGCLCPILAAYSKECARKGIIVDWRAEVRECGIHCTGGQKYQVCGNICTHTCLDLAMNPNCKRKCVEGCNCLEGFSLDNSGICVPVTECPCIYDNKEYKPGYEMLQEQADGSVQVCVCNNVGWNCWEPSENDTLAMVPQIQCSKEQHLVYTDCMPEEEYTCQTMHLRPPEVALCHAGCICEPGYVKDIDTGDCIRHSQCPCHHGGRSYQEGDTITEECNTCTCEGGQWLCSDTQCPGICSAWGDSHYKTFDGRLYEFHGTCDYLLAKAKSSSADSFEVTIQNVPCGTDGVTCAKSVTLRVGSGDSQEVVQFSKNKPPPMKNLTRTIIREAGIFLFAEVTDMGLVLQWDRGTRAYLRLDPSWTGKVRGLCGNYNGDEQDDFLTPSGGSSEVSVRIFGDSWRLQNYCPESYIVQDTCSLNSHRRVWASEKCAVLKSTTFAPCHSEVPVEPYIERCEFDACGCNAGGDCECLCTAIAAYGHECNIHGVYISWRSQQLCPMQCDETCEHYEPCIPTCPHETCDTLLDPASPVCTQDACVEGCAKDLCPPGQVHKSATDPECVPKVDCEKRCMEIEGEVYLEGDIISQDNCHTCSCSRKKKICRGTPCETTTVEVTPRISTPSPTTSTPPFFKNCNDGWSEWLNNDKPVIFRKNSDVEPIPEKIEKSLTNHAWCEYSQIVDIRCRSVGTHKPHTEQYGVQCNVEKGLTCHGKDNVDVDEACWDYEVSFLCDCSVSTVEMTTSTTPLTPVTPPSLVTPSSPPATVAVPMTCEEEGWSQWFNIHFPTTEGEFEEVSEIRKIASLCPDHYISEVECRSVRSGDVESVVTCDKHGARCRNNGGHQYCQDYEIRVRCQCDCQDWLGMENFTIPNERISASSMMQQDDKPYSARLNADWAWTAKAVDEHDADAIQNEWLQVDLAEVKELTGVITQGHPYFDQYVERFAIQISETGASWDDIKDEFSRFAKQFQGNDDRSTPVTNLFPEPVFARYIRIIPLQFFTAISLRLEIKGCDVKEEETTPLEGFSTTPLVPFPVLVQEVCIHGWTDWMNTHTPGPSDWDDKDDLQSLSLQYQFCPAHHIIDTQCQVVGIGQSYELAGQVGIICNINNGLQCNDDLQAPQRCYDYEIRFFCDCGITTLSMAPFTTTTIYSTTPKITESCSFADEQIKPHDDCRKFLECVQSSPSERRYIEKECGPGTFFNPLIKVCDFEFNVLLVREDCARVTTKPPKLIVSLPSTSTQPSTTTQVPCLEDYWTDWFNTSHPDNEDGDYETIELIRLKGFNICDDMYIKDIECEFNKQEEELSDYRGGYKGGRKSRGRKGGSRKGGSIFEKYTTVRTNFQRSSDNDVQCTTDLGLICENSLQFGPKKCEDYAIRVLCSCETTRKTSPSIPHTTPYVDVQGSTIITTPYTLSPKCPPKYSFLENAVPCENVCMYHRSQLHKAKECTREDQYAQACTTCPPGQFLRDKITCVPQEDCNCILPNGMAAPPGQVFKVDECEVCQCSNNFLMCSSICTLETTFPPAVTEKPSFKCGEWSSWVSGEPVEGIDQGLLSAIRSRHPDMCRFPYRLECRIKTNETLSDWLPIDELSSRKVEKVACDRKCIANSNLPGCEVYEVRFVCGCDEFQISLEGEFTPPPKATVSPSVASESTTYVSEYPTNVTTSWPLLNDVCMGSSTYEQCAMPCDRICIYYLGVLRANGQCLLEGDCAPGCVERNQKNTCPDGFLMANESHCVSIEDCTCRLPNGQPVPGGIWLDVTECEQCMCQNNQILCTKKQECIEATTELEIIPSTLPTVQISVPSTTTQNINELIESLHKCNDWTPFYSARERDKDGLTISLDKLRSQKEFHCENPTNATCREASTHIPAESLGQMLTCDTKTGLSCKNLDNSKDCYNYEIAFYCYCEEEETTPHTSVTTTLGPTSTIAACDSWSPWINDHKKPWQTEGDTEHKTLQQLREQYGFCLEGQLAKIECVIAANGKAPSDEGTTCDIRFGFHCSNSAQSPRTCLDYKIRYYCSCETTTVITTILPEFFTPPPVCEPDKYIHLLEYVDDSAFSSTPSRSYMYGPSHARLYNDDGTPTTGSWSPYTNDRQQYLQVNLGSVVPVYGVEIAGNPLTRERITSFYVHTSRDGETWSIVPQDPKDPTGYTKVFQGPVSASQSLLQLFAVPIEAQFVKILPSAWAKGIAVRVEVLGCELPTLPAETTSAEPICEEPMGVENGEMSLNQIEVSSNLDDRESYYGKSNLPLNSKSEFAALAGAWVAQPKDDQYVRFNFIEPSKISAILSQGRPDSDDWVESFTVRYSPDGKVWNDIKETDSSIKIFAANYDRNTVVKTKFDRVIHAKFLEIRPKTWKNNIALRAEILGCFHPYRM